MTYITLIYVIVSDFQIISNSFFTISTSSHNTQTYPHETRSINEEKIWENREEADKNKGIASSSNQKCKVYNTFKVIIIVLRHEQKIFLQDLQ
jgi:hypothetical protein